MGLGPPVCEECVLIMKLNETFPWWSCPSCGKSGNDNNNPVKGLFQVDQSLYLKKRN